MVFHVIPLYALSQQPLPSGFRLSTPHEIPVGPCSCSAPDFAEFGSGGVLAALSDRCPPGAGVPAVGRRFPVTFHWSASGVAAGGGHDAGR